MIMTASPNGQGQRPRPTAGRDGRGALLESFNLTALGRVPAVFICENNQYATTLPVGASVAGTIAGRADAFGNPAERVDGRDPEIMHAAMTRAVTRARAGPGVAAIREEGTARL